VRGRSQDDELKAEKQQQLQDFFWEIDKMDTTSEDFIRACLIYGTSYLQVSWKKDVRKLKFLNTKDIASKKYTWTEKEKVFFDAPHCEWVDNYNLWMDWHNSARSSKQYWFKRLVLTEGDIRRRYPMADEERLQMAFHSPGGDLIDYAAIRPQTRTVNLYTTKESAANQISASGTVYGTDKYFSTLATQVKMFEVFEWHRPFEDAYAVMVGGSYVPILKGAFIPNPFDFKEAPFIECTYLKIPGEFEGYGLPHILESPQIMLNLIKNQRLDAATLSIHKMWVVNPLANINKDELVTRPFGIIYSVDPNGVREVQFSDVKMSAYKEEELLKGDMQYASGVDDFSMGVGAGGSSSATEVRHLRESTLERVRMFVNHLGDAYADVFRYWMDMTRQLFSESMTMRVIGEDGTVKFPLIEKDDLMGRFDYKAAVLPSIAGQDEVKKKQNMDLFQLLINLPFVDPQKLTSRVLSSFDWDLESISAKQDGTQPNSDPNAAAAAGGQDPMAMLAAAGAGQGAPAGAAPQGQPLPQEPPTSGAMPPDAQGGPGFSLVPRSTLHSVTRYLRDTGETEPYNASSSPFRELSSPVNLLNMGGTPPTVTGVKDAMGKGMPNIAGHNRPVGGKVNTNIPSGSKTTSTGSNILNRTFSLQR
jgi:hypothetical protein